MTQAPAMVSAPDEAATARLAEDIAMVAGPGWTIRLEGDLGAGKSTFARAFIRTLAKDARLEVPSPTYTLVQRYDEADPPVLHADLYRLSDPSELIELGLDDPDDPAIRLIEWPQRAGARAFADALTLSFSLHKSGARGDFGEVPRAVQFSGPSSMLKAVERSARIRGFLTDAGWGAGRRMRLQGDASTRRYERLAEASSILMDAPRRPDGPPVRDGKPYSRLVHLAESVHAFAAIGAALRARGFAAPAIHAADLNDGLLLLEDLGHETILTPDGAPDPQRYRAAATLLADLHAQRWPERLPVPDGGEHRLYHYDSDVFLTEIGLCAQWYVPFRGNAGLDEAPSDRASFDETAFNAAWRHALALFEDEPPTLTLRDYHSPNIIWRPGETGTDRLGLIDHQDALLGPPAYDLASLVQDARVTIPPDLQDMLVRAYATARGADCDDLEALRTRVTLMAAQRATKLLGIFVRLSRRDGKHGYLRHLARIEDYMRQLLPHPALAGLKPFYDHLLPPAGTDGDASKALP